MLASRSTKTVICHSKVPRESCSLCEHKGNHVMRKKMREGRTKGAGKESHDQLCNTSY
ncbi:unnamed protein product [Musa acuminata subsp. malaccensis]|uniref:(wild Malaysian banana) hypothetical protein n=1 Tax=Musa acuminata subsp. malaccensis TaxID=214687 RepID=A0A804J9D7_MUSAM|nr:unnamed protein product [Musa acuminata subsp. malaccensis]